jgi:RNase P subunit RPR2
MFLRENTSVFALWFFMARLKCKKCGNVFEQDITAGVVLGPHIGPYKRLTCPACGKGSWFNIYSSVKDPVTWPPQKKKEERAEQQLSEEELEKNQIEESKYERT